MKKKSKSKKVYRHVRYAIPGSVTSPATERALQEAMVQMKVEGNKIIYDPTRPLTDPDPINPSHYKSHPSGIECIQISRHMTFNCGNAIKYIWRHDQKGNPVENLEKAIWYLNDEIKRLKGEY